MADSALPVRRYAEWRPTTIHRIPVEWIGFGAAALAFGAMTFFVDRGNYLFWIVSGFVGKWTSVVVAERRMRALRDDPNGGQFAATLLLEREVHFGYDEGLLAFEEGWLVFQGQRCTFSIGAGDIVTAVTGAGTLRLLFNAPGGILEANLKTRPDARFTSAANHWRAAKQKSEGSVLPPRLPNENARRAGRTLVWIALAVGLPLALGFVLRGGHVYRGFVPVAVAVAVLCATVRAAEIKAALEHLERGEPRRLRFWEARSRRPSLGSGDGT